MAEHQAEVDMENSSHLLVDALGKPTTQSSEASGRVNGHSSIPNTADRGKSLDSSKQVPEIRKGVKPGSFIDLLVKGGARATGKQFTDNEKSQQVPPPPPTHTLTFLTHSPLDVDPPGCGLCFMTRSQKLLTQEFCFCNLMSTCVSFLRSAMDT